MKKHRLKPHFLWVFWYNHQGFLHPYPTSLNLKFRRYKYSARFWYNLQQSNLVFSFLMPPTTSLTLANPPACLRKPRQNFLSHLHAPPFGLNIIKPSYTPRYSLLWSPAAPPNTAYKPTLQMAQQQAEWATTAATIIIIIYNPVIHYSATRSAKTEPVQCVIKFNL